MACRAPRHASGARALSRARRPRAAQAVHGSEGVPRDARGRVTRQPAAPPAHLPALAALPPRLDARRAAPPAPPSTPPACPTATGSVRDGACALPGCTSSGRGGGAERGSDPSRQPGQGGRCARSALRSLSRVRAAPLTARLRQVARRTLIAPYPTLNLYAGRQASSRAPRCAAARRWSPTSARRWAWRSWPRACRSCCACSTPRYTPCTTPPATGAARGPTAGAARARRRACDAHRRSARTAPATQVTLSGHWCPLVEGVLLCERHWSACHGRPFRIECCHSRC